MSSNLVAPGDNELSITDLGPLAWVLDELRKSLDGATKAMRRFVRDAELARGSDLTELDASHLRIARQQLHQAVGALEMVGLEAPAKFLRAMESLAQRFVQRPEQCSDEAANCMERASFALTEYLDGVLKGKSASSVALFPQYKTLMELAGAERIHPADLWPPAWQWVSIAVPEGTEPREIGPDVRREMDHAVLRLVKYGDDKAARRLQAISLGLAASAHSSEERTFWMVSAAYFEGTALHLFEGDVYTKRAASRILQQYVALAKGQHSVSERLAQDIVFFCSRAIPSEASDAPVLAAVRKAYGLSRAKPVDYVHEQFGRFDPAMLVLARKRIASAAETWSALAGGDVNRLKPAAEQFAAVADAVTKLHAESGELAKALSRAIEATARTGAAPSPAVAMEVATSVLYLEAAYEDLDPTDNQMADRSARLAQRLQHVTDGGEPEPLEAWMEDLYRRVSDRQTMGSVVDELRTTLAEVEKSLDQFFRDPRDKGPLREVPSQLAQMRGVFSVLGLDQPSIAALRMRASVEQFLVDDVDEVSARSGIFEKLGNSLGAMGFLIDMLSYQRTLAKTLFVYDEELAEFKPLMGRERNVLPEAVAPSSDGIEDDMAALAALTGQSQPETSGNAEKTQPVATPAEPLQEEDDDSAELLDIFLDEAREVVARGRDAIAALKLDPTNLADQTTLRRAFHTLKGSSRMVGLNEFGEAAWSFEQLLNTSLAEQRPASEALIATSTEAMTAFERWVRDIESGDASSWSAAEFRKTSDALRLHDQWVPLVVPLETPVAEREATEDVAQEVHEPLSVVEEIPAADAHEISNVDFAATEIGAPEMLETVSVRDFEPTQLPDELELSSTEPPEHAGFAATQMFDFAQTTALDTHSPNVGVSSKADLEPEELDLGDFDFGDFEPPAKTELAPLETRLAEMYVEEPLPQVDSIPVDEPESGGSALVLEFPEPLAPVQQPQVDEVASGDVDDGMKVIGPLRMSIPLYNVYLNEADEWSRRLQTELGEWAMELAHPVPDSVISLAHSLLGSSATVGFMALSNMAKALEQALQHVQLHRQVQSAHAAVFCDAAEDIRRLLHQFAAGFVKEADSEVLHSLQVIIDTEFPAPVMEESSINEEDDQAFPEPLGATDGAAVLVQEALNIEVPDVLPAVVAEAAPLVVLDEQDDDLDAEDHLDADLLPIFEEEATELMPQLGSALRQWVARPDNLGARSEVLRLLHTLKGSARLAGAMRMGEMGHRMESSIEQLGAEGLQSIQLEPLLGRFDALQAAFASLGKLPEVDAGVASDLQTPVPLEAVPATNSVPAVAPLPKALPAIQAPAMAMPRVQGNQSVRVRSQLLDRLVNQAGEVMITRSRMDERLTQLRASLGELTGNLDRLRQQLRDVELQAESQMQSRLAQTKDSAQAFDPLEFDRFTRVQELTRMMAESVNDVATVQRNLQRSVEGTEDDLIAQGRQARELQKDLLRTRMVEFDGISDRLYGVVRQASKDAGKQVKLDISGGAIEIDRGVLDRMAPAFEHLLRNAVAHGIESPADRSAAGKAASGNITVEVHQESNDVTVSFTDDGAGLHLDRIRAKAEAKGLIGVGDSLSDADAANLIFMPGFSTADEVTELSGRGIGMDVVRAEVHALGGRIETQTQANAGTTFKLVLPLTTAVTQVVILRMGEFSIGVPANIMETVLRVPAAQLDTAYAQQAFSFGEEQVPFFWGGALLQVSAKSTDAGGKTLPVAIFRSAGQRLAVHIDEVLGNREVVVKNLGPQLARLPGLAGMSVLASGAVVLIYNPVALASVYGDQARGLGTEATPVNALLETTSDVPVKAAATVASGTQLPLVLVVDDSITVRRVTQRLLKREGYRVALANDGLQALEKLQEEIPAVVLSDIEMPRMDGFDLARNIRADAKLQGLPIIMITSRIAEKHREHARELGVDHYLGKPYSEDELLGLVRGYCSVAVPA
ncbi:Hpt domain-containing protein [Rhodoferax mekongensis]|uniref:Hpt domain-containing protein n=1 Tax=Rhodoferax mekongensis TaxID=3068341 RepID=UPI0028BDC6A5|nr:Hpt domain-containing protein [Rhodoferax sp. TBRC 17199]MDT7516655.1 Hpt domain-containing protein [Rhodoferax sp. TBRC 17199]